MASTAPPIAPPAHDLPPASAGDFVRTPFFLKRPIKAKVGGATFELHGVEMRAFDLIDLPLLDQFNGQPIALVQNLISRMCDVELTHVEQLCLDDLGMLSSEVLFQVDQVCAAMELAPRYYTAAPAVINPAAGLQAA